MEPDNRPLAFVVDDGEPVRSLIVEMLADEGFRVLDFESGESALGALDEVQPSLVLSDLRLGRGMSGTELLTAVIHKRPETKCVLMSAGFKAGVSHNSQLHVLAKPFSRKELLELLGVLRLI